MAEYIDKAEIIADLDDSLMSGAALLDRDLRVIKIIRIFKLMINDFPAADVQPVKHGRWIPLGDDMWLCSNCRENKIFSAHESDRTEKQRYCCRCGARMDGDTNG